MGMSLEEMNLIFAMALGAVRPSNESYQYATYQYLMNHLFKDFIESLGIVASRLRKGSTFCVLQTHQQLSAIARFGGWSDGKEISRIMSREKSVRNVSSVVEQIIDKGRPS